MTQKGPAPSYSRGPDGVSRNKRRPWLPTSFQFCLIQGNSLNEAGQYYFQNPIILFFVFSWKSHPFHVK